MLNKLLKKLLHYFIFITLYSAHCLAQQPQVTIQPAFGTSDDFYTLTLSVSGPKVSPLRFAEFKPSDVFEITQQGTSSQRQIINGKESSEYSISFQVNFKKNVATGDYPIPEGTVELNGTSVAIPQKKITVVSTAKPNKRKSQRKNYSSTAGIKITQYLSKKTAYVGEQITYTAEITHDRSFVGGNLEDYEISGFWRERLGDKERNVFNLAGKTVSTFSEVLIPVKSGTVTIPPRVLQAKIRSRTRPRRNRRSRRGSFFSPFSIFDQNYTRKNLKTNPITIDIKPLPATSISGYIPVGILQANTSLNKTKIKAGESAILQVTVQGTANLRPFKLEDTPRSESGFKLYFDKPELRTGVQDGTIIFSKTFDVTIVPDTAGEIKVPQFTIHYFNTNDETYQTVKTKALKLNVTGQFPEKVNTKETKILRTPEDPKDNDALQANELAPLDSVAKSKESSLYISNKITLIITLLLLLSAFIARFIFNKKAFYLKNPGYLKKKNALSNALLLLEKKEFENSISQYLKDSFNINTSTNTSKEIAELLSRKIKNDDIVKSLCLLLEKVEHSEFSKNADKTLLNTNAEAIKNILHTLEEERSS